MKKKHGIGRANTNTREISSDPGFQPYADGIQHGIYADGTEEWRFDGWLHREDGPAILWPDGSYEYRLNGMLHRIDGPAVKDRRLPCEWWLNGKIIRDQKEYMKKAGIDKETMMTIILKYGEIQ